MKKLVNLENGEIIEGNLEKVDITGEFFGEFPTVQLVSKEGKIIPISFAEVETAVCEEGKYGYVTPVLQCSIQLDLDSAVLKEICNIVKQKSKK